MGKLIGLLNEAKDYLKKTDDEVVKLQEEYAEKRSEMILVVLTEICEVAEAVWDSLDEDVREKHQEAMTNLTLTLSKSRFHKDFRVTRIDSEVARLAADVDEHLDGCVNAEDLEELVELITDVERIYKSIAERKPEFDAFLKAVSNQYNAPSPHVRECEMEAWRKSARELREYTIEQEIKWFGELYKDLYSTGVIHECSEDLKLFVRKHDSIKINLNTTCPRPWELGVSQTDEARKLVKLVDSYKKRIHADEKYLEEERSHKEVNEIGGRFIKEFYDYVRVYDHLGCGEDKYAAFVARLKDIHASVPHVHHVTCMDEVLRMIEFSHDFKEFVAEMERAYLSNLIRKERRVVPLIQYQVAEQFEKMYSDYVDRQVPWVIGFSMSDGVRALVAEDERIAKEQKPSTTFLEALEAWCKKARESVK